MGSQVLILITSLLMFFMPAQTTVPFKQGTTLNVSVENFTGKGTTIYVLDTGIDVNNKEFNGKASEYEFQPLNQLIGTPSNKECVIHGTGVASIAHKYAPDAEIKSVRISDCDGTSFDFLISQAIEHIINDGNKNNKIINLSLNFKDWQLSGVFTEASIERAASNGIVVTIAAGNIITDKDNPIRDACLRSPSRILNALTIGSYNPKTDDKSSYTAVGDCVDVYAPGDGMIYDVSVDGDVYSIGTSYAAPYAAAMVARIFEQYPEAKMEDVTATVSAKSNFQDFIKMNNPN